MVNMQIKKTNISGKGYWKLNTSILKQKNFQKLFKLFCKDWQAQINKYSSLNLWWEIGKINLKRMAIRFSTEKNSKTNIVLQKLTNNKLQEKAKKQPDFTTIDKW